jgi:hypothetical protein
MHGRNILQRTIDTKLLYYLRTSPVPGAYLDMAQGLGEYDVIELDGGHETLFINPEALAGGLLKALQ